MISTLSIVHGQIWVHLRLVRRNIKTTEWAKYLYRIVVLRCVCVRERETETQIQRERDGKASKRQRRKEFVLQEMKQNKNKQVGVFPSKRKELLIRTPSPEIKDLGAEVPKLFGIKDQFHGRQFFHRWRVMVSGWLKHITCLMHFISIIVTSTSPHIIRH